MIDFTPVSLDLETSSSDYEHGVILSIGMVNFITGAEFYEEIKYTEPIYVSAEAMRVNKLDIRALDLGPKPLLEECDDAAFEFVKDIKFPKPMGMNVGTFDMRFVQKYMGKLNNKFGYRSIDLNALIFAQAILLGNTFESTKKGYKKYGYNIAKKIKSELNPHNALFDCYSNCAIFSVITQYKPEWMENYL